MLVYTILGGMISVIITDYIQFVVLSIGLMLSVVFSVYHLGWFEIFTKLESLLDNSEAIYRTRRGR